MNVLIHPGYLIWGNNKFEVARLHSYITEAKSLTHVGMFLGQ